jgi:hypothetical protein
MRRQRNDDRVLVFDGNGNYLGMYGNGNGQFTAVLLISA